MRDPPRASALEQQLRDIVATSQDWIWEHDRDGKFTFCSDSVRNTLGYAPEEIVGRNASQYVHPEDLAALDFAMHTLGPNQRTATNLQARWRHRNGSYRWLERNMLVLLGEGGQVVGFRGSERDFTERRRQEKHISRLTRVLEDAERRQQRHGAHPPAARDPGRSLPACNRRGRLRERHGGAHRAWHAHRAADRLVRQRRSARLAQQLTFSIAESAGEDTSVIGRVLRTGAVAGLQRSAARWRWRWRARASLHGLAASAAWSPIHCWWTARRSAR